MAARRAGNAGMTALQIFSAIPKYYNEKVSVRADCFEGGVESIAWEQRKPYDEFDFGYVLTVHKSQGSQWDDVVLFDESFAFQDSRARWLYTGITRAAKRLSIVV